MILSRFPSESLTRLIVPADRWTPFPAAADRPAWEALPPWIRATLLAAGEARRGFSWPFLPASESMSFLRDGNRTRYESPYFARRAALVDLVLAECAAADGRFLDDAINGIWAVCEESSWSLPAHLERTASNGGLPDVRTPMVDLFAAETGALLAWTAYLLGPRLTTVSALLETRIRDEISHRVLTPALTRDDFWWMGFDPRRHLNNWTPWIVSNWIACALLQERDPARRQAALAKAIGCLDRFLASHPADGGCDEGPMYWTHAAAALFDALEWLHSASAGRVNLFDEPLVQEMGRFITRVQIADLWFVNFADAGPRVSPPAAVVYGYGVRTGDAGLQTLGAWLQRQQSSPSTRQKDSLGRVLLGLFTFRDAETSMPARSPLPRDAWLGVVGVMTARDAAGSPDGWFVAAKGGHNGESHNHNDIGNFLVYRDGAPLLVDVGVGSYTRQTFGPERYTIWTMQSAWHNLLPTCDGVMQMPGRERASREAHWHADDGAAELSLEIQEAYPPEAGLARWQRTVRLERARRVVIEDTFTLTRDVKEVLLSLITPSEPSLVAPDTIALAPRELPGNLHSAAGRVQLSGVPFTLDIETVPLTSALPTSAWGDRLYRILVRLANPPRTGRLLTEVLP
ncbi:MAG: heparinase II/III family protein [Phycisphaerae bacterium]|nr:heparinase II/III family protein [Phycisphaerae bacterium]